MKTEKKQIKTTSKFNLEKLRVAHLDNLNDVNGGSGLNIDGDVMTTTGTSVKSIVRD
nr:hypothetical protein [Flavobacterium sp.]